MKDANKEFIDRTVKMWRSRTTGRLSEEDARKIAENITSYFEVLLEWEAQEKEGEAVEANDSLYAKSA